MNSSNTESKHILERLKNGDQKAFEYIFNKYYNHIYNFVLNTLFDKIFAEDITQATLLVLWEQREKIDTEKNIAHYLFTIAKNKVFRQTERLILKSKYAEFVKSKQIDISDFIFIEEKVNNEILKKIIYDLVEELPSSRKEIFLLSHKENLSNKSIAERLSISEKTVETQIRRSILFLKSKLSHLNIFLTFL